MGALNFKHLKKIGEDEHFIHVHDTKAGTHFPILKHGLGKEMLGKVVQHFSGASGDPADSVVKEDAAAEQAVAQAAPATSGGLLSDQNIAAAGDAVLPWVQKVDQTLSNPVIARGLSAAGGALPAGAGLALQKIGDAYGGAPKDTPLPPDAPEAVPAGAQPQAPAVPQPMPPKGAGAGNSGIPSNGAQDKAINAAAKAETELATIEAQNKEKMAQEQLASQQAHQADLQAKIKQKDDEYRQNQADKEKLQADIASSKIDGNAWWHNRSTGGKVASIIGMVLGGLSQGFNGGPNLALEAMHKAAEADVEDQKANLGKKQSQLQRYIEQGHDIQEAKKLAVADAQNVLAGQLQMSATKYGTPPAKQAANAIASELAKKAFEERTAAHGATLKNVLAVADIRKTNAEAAKDAAAAGKVGGEQQLFSLLAGNGPKGKDAKGGIGVDLSQEQLAAAAADPKVAPRMVRLPTGKYGLAQSDEDAKKVKDVLEKTEHYKQLLAQVQHLHDLHPHGISRLTSPEEYGAADRIQNELVETAGEVANLTRLTGEEVKLRADELPRVTDLQWGKQASGQLSAATKDADSRILNAIKTRLVNR